jgi:hypothetical protein
MILSANEIEVTAAPYLFGQSGNTPAQNRTAAQNAIDDAIVAFKADGFPRTLTFYGLTGEVRIDGPLIVTDFNGTTYRPVTVHFAGPGGYAISHIYMPDGTQPLLIFQATRACKVTGLNFRGAINANPSIEQIVNDDRANPWWNPSGAISTNGYTPHAGIAMDPFSTDQTTADQYPGLSSYYSTGMGIAGSNTLHIEDCTFAGFTVGVAWNCSKGTLQGDGCTLVRSRFFRCKTVVASGNDQARMCSIVDVFINYSGTLFDGRSYGNGLGVMPSIRGGQHTIGKQVFIASGSRYAGDIHGLKTEEMWRLGLWESGSTLTLVGCEFKTKVCSVNGEPVLAAPDAWLEAGGGVNFFGGRIWTYDNIQDEMNIYANGGGGRVVFHGVAMEAPFAVNYSTSNGKPVLRYLDCTRLATPSGGVYGLSEEYRGSYLDFGRKQNIMRTGARFVEHDLNEAREYREWISLGNEVVTMDVGASVTIPGDGSAHFTSANPAKYQIGEYVHTTTPWTMTPWRDGVPAGTTGANSRLTIGKVAAIAGTTISLVNVPKGLHISASGIDPNRTITLDIVLARDGAMRPRMMLTTASGSTSATISSVTGYSVGDRIRGQGLASGTWITAMNGTSITLSEAATATDTVEVYDARVVVRGYRTLSAPPAGTWFKGDVFDNFGFDANALNRASMLRRYICVRGGTNPTWINEYYMPESKATASASYAPIIGDVGMRIRLSAAGTSMPMLPSDATLDVPVGGWIEFERTGGGSQTMTAGPGATIVSRGGLVTLNGQYAVVRASKVAANTWSLSGDLA